MMIQHSIYTIIVIFIYFVAENQKKYSIMSHCLPWIRRQIYK